jgi:glutaredoxin 3
VSARLLIVTAAGAASGDTAAPAAFLRENESMSRKLLSVIAILLVFGAGVFGGRGATALMQWIDAQEPVSLGDHGALLRRADAEVILFSLSTCPYCRQARDWLDAHHVPFKELVVDTDAQAQSLFDALKEEAVPVLVTRDRMIRGFEADAYAQAVAGNAKLAEHARTVRQRVAVVAVD